MTDTDPINPITQLRRIKGNAAHTNGEKIQNAYT